MPVYRRKGKLYFTKRKVVCHNISQDLIKAITKEAKEKGRNRSEYIEIILRQRANPDKSTLVGRYQELLAEIEIIKGKIRSKQIQDATIIIKEEGDL